MPRLNDQERSSYSKAIEIAPKGSVVLELGPILDFTGHRKQFLVPAEIAKILAQSGNFTAAEIGQTSKRLGFRDASFPTRLMPQKLLKAVENEYQTKANLQQAFTALLAALLLYQESMTKSNIALAPDQHGIYEWLEPVEIQWDQLDVLRSLGLTDAVTTESFRGGKVPIFVAKGKKLLRAVSNRGYSNESNKGYKNKIELDEAVYMGIRYKSPEFSKLRLLSFLAWENYLNALFEAELRGCLLRLKDGGLDEFTIQEMREFLMKILEILKNLIVVLPGMKFASKKEYSPEKTVMNTLLMEFTEIQKFPSLKAYQEAKRAERAVAKAQRAALRAQNSPEAKSESKVPASDQKPLSSSQPNAPALI